MVKAVSLWRQSKAEIYHSVTSHCEGSKKIIVWQFLRRHFYNEMTFYMSKDQREFDCACHDPFSSTQAILASMTALRLIISYLNLRQSLVYVDPAYVVALTLKAPICWSLLNSLPFLSHLSVGVGLPFAWQWSIAEELV